jgi:ferredoxin
MAHVVTDACIACKYTDCVEYCPVDCFHEGPNFLVIDPEECIDCALCVSECPVNAIASQYVLDDEQLPFIEINATLSHQWPVINIKKQALSSAEDMKHITGKINLIKDY